VRLDSAALVVLPELRVSEEQQVSAALRVFRDQQDQLANVESAELRANVV